MNKAIFVDLNSLLTVDSVYRCQPFYIRLGEATKHFLKVLSLADFKLVTMFSLMGIINEFDASLVKKEVEYQLGQNGVGLDGFYLCPHFGEDCSCQRPKAGLLFEAAKDLNLELASSWVIGDKLDDIEAGNRAGCKTVLIANGHETSWQVTALRQPLFVSSSFEMAAGTVILRNIYNKIAQAGKPPAASLANQTSN